ncbi:CLUMA_CG015468, isoform A [Clunio marinus]|uniref:CLUMA_CG015468, isoform A n=1 Tax=Clunio marinus TaxID=568069 RepID=A0A1J1IPN7_9DIPT|nr:CLUMA_CG015468, isoform A [Clunio marinus]
MKKPARCIVFKKIELNSAFELLLGTVFYGKFLISDELTCLSKSNTEMEVLGWFAGKPVRKSFANRFTTKPRFSGHLWVSEMVPNKLNKVFNNPQNMLRQGKHRSGLTLIPNFSSLINKETETDFFVVLTSVFTEIPQSMILENEFMTTLLQQNLIALDD